MCSALSGMVLPPQRDGQMQPEVFDRGSDMDTGGSCYFLLLHPRRSLPRRVAVQWFDIGCTRIMGTVGTADLAEFPYPKG